MLKGLKYIIFLKKNVVNCLSGELGVQSISVMIRYVHCKLATVKKLIKADISSSYKPFVTVASLQEMPYLSLFQTNFQAEAEVHVMQMFSFFFFSCDRQMEEITQEQSCQKTPNF